MYTIYRYICIHLAIFTYIYIYILTDISYQYINNKHTTTNKAGSTLEAMALAVEHCEVFVVAMCQAYKDSASCRTGY